MNLVMMQQTKLTHVITTSSDPHCPCTSILIIETVDATLSKIINIHGQTIINIIFMSFQHTERFHIFSETIGFSLHYLISYQ